MKIFFLSVGLAICLVCNSSCLSAKENHYLTLSELQSLGYSDRNARASELLEKIKIADIMVKEKISLFWREHFIDKDVGVYPSDDENGPFNNYLLEWSPLWFSFSFLYTPREKNKDADYGKDVAFNIFRPVCQLPLKNEDLAHYLNGYLLEASTERSPIPGGKQYFYLKKLGHNYIFDVEFKTEKDAKDPIFGRLLGGDEAHLVGWISGDTIIIVMSTLSLSVFPQELIEAYLNKHPSDINESDFSPDINAWVKKEIALRISQLNHQDIKVRKFAFNRLCDLIPEQANEILTKSFYNEVMSKEPQKAIETASEWWARTKDKVFQWDENQRKLIIQDK